MTIGLPHPVLLSYLPQKLLCAVHATCCNLRGRQWGSQRPALLFVSRHSFPYLVAYHAHVLHELRCRGFKPSPKWQDPDYRGRKLDPWPRGEGNPIRRDLAYPHHTGADYGASLAYLRRRTDLGDQDRIRLSLAPERIP